MFDAVRQIIESRLLSLSGSSYDTTVSDSPDGETLTSIVNKNPPVRDIANLKVLNPTYTTFQNDLLITFGSNDTVSGSGINVIGFPSEFLVPGNSALFALAIHNGVSSSPPVDTFAEFLVIRTADQNATLEVKITSWIDAINGVGDLGFTADEVVGSDSIRIIPKTRAGSFLAESLSVGRTDGFNISIDYNYIPPRTWVIVAREFPLFLEGRQFTQPTNARFSVLLIQDAASVGREFGNVKNARRQSGSVRVKLYAPHGTGTKIVRDMADQFDDVLAYTAGDSDTGNSGTLFMKAGSLRQVSENNDGFLEYNLDYIYDYYTT